MTASTVIRSSSIGASRHGRPRLFQHIMAMGEPGGQEDARNHKALLVDDNLDLLEVAATLFQRYGFDVLTAANGAEAMEILRRTPDIDVLFTDVVMPGMSGIQLGHEARKIMPDIKVILVSGYATVAGNAGYGSIHDFDFLKKPYRFSDVIKLLEKLD